MHGPILLLYALLALYAAEIVIPLVLVAVAALVRRARRPRGTMRTA